LVSGNLWSDLAGLHPCYGGCWYCPRPRASYYAHNGYGLSWTRRRTQEEESIIFALRGKVSLLMFFAHICGEFIFPFLMAGNPGEKRTGVAESLIVSHFDRRLCALRPCWHSPAHPTQWVVFHFSYAVKNICKAEKIYNPDASLESV